MARRRRLTGPLIAALCAHVLFAVFFAYGGRSFRAPPDMRAVDVTLVPELFVRPKPPPVAPLKAGPRGQASAPSPAPNVLTQPAPAAIQQAQTNAPSTDDAAAANFRAALRASAGCAHADAMDLTKAERDRCAERQLAMGKGAPEMPAPMDPDKRAYFDAVAAAYDQQSHGGPMSGTYPAAGCSIKFSGLTIVKSKPPPNSLSAGPCFISPPRGFLTEESGVERR